MTAARRILVTGATGFIGRHALAPLRDRGFEVHAAARSPRDLPVGVQGHAIDLIAPDAADATRALLETLKPTHLLHLAWYAEHGKFWNSPYNLDWLAATLALLRDFAAAGGTRFVGAGTCAEYDWSATATENRLDEEQTPLRPATLYGAAKASAFMTGSALAKTAGIDFAWGRIFHLFGEGEAPGRIIPTIIRAHLTGGSVDCGPADQRFEFLPAVSIADGFAHLCDSDVQGAFNIGTGEGKTLRELSARIAALVRQATGESRGEIRFGVRENSGPASLVPSAKKITASGWAPPETLETGLESYVAMLRHAP